MEIAQEHGKMRPEPNRLLPQAGTAGTGQRTSMEMRRNWPHSHSHTMHASHARM